MQRQICLISFDASSEDMGSLYLKWYGVWIAQLLKPSLYLTTTALSQKK